MQYKIITNQAGERYLETTKHDYELIHTPYLNKGMAFTEEEREIFGLYGLIPPMVATIEDQRYRSYEAFKSKTSDLEKYIYLRDLQDSNETLFYNLLLHHLAELIPIVYTPTVGLGCQKYSSVYQRQRGVFIAYPYRDRIDQILSNQCFNRVEVIVVTDGERILGLGDLGANGMGIPIGKLSLYSVCAGLDPNTTLPITLDVGTNNHELLNDPLYIGWRHERIRGADYDDLIARFVTAIKTRFPHVMLQWEDFAQQNANRILQTYREQLCTFNDDIQGTAAVATGTLLAAIEVTGVPLSEQVIVVAGAGSAGCGISELLVHALMNEGLTEQEARAHFYLVDRGGLLLEGQSNLLPFQQKFMQSTGRIANWDYNDKNFVTLMDVIKNIKATVLIGVSGQPGLFEEALVKEMAAKVPRPIIFPLSNPTSRSEAVPEDLILWTQDRVIMGTGSPFPNIIKNGHSFRVDQTNNSYIFPGMGLGLIAVKAKWATDKMFMLAAKALASCSPAKLNREENLLPSLSDIRTISIKVATAVANEAISEGLATQIDKPVNQLIQEKMWEPLYLPYKKS